MSTTLQEPSVTSHTSASASGATSSARSFFEENGYYLAKGVFSPEEMRELEIDFDRIVAQMNSFGAENAVWGGEESARVGSKNTVIYHTHNVQIYSAAWLRAFMNPRFLDVVQELIGPDIILHHSKLFQKPSEKGSPFPMHQDWPYFPTIKDKMIAGIIHVTRATDEMGCLRVYPGSHRLGRVENTNGQSRSEFLDQYPLDGAVALEAEPGDIAFFHYFTLHGSKPNVSPHIRKTVLTQLHPGDDRVEEGNRHPNARLVLRGWNHHSRRALGNE
ncbi:phytanoyl-CoA dioxygenase family protein [Verrucomicrobia bacterium LW23]|nr:phytanoyl-CoA dioxygenase family protein [Verrucomicrobia bacterium LW23]PTY04338.1 phytanoyl-CoA dioxygenase family protein [Verrucomicrobia bacterium LW23]